MNPKASRALPEDLKRLPRGLQKGSETAKAFQDAPKDVRTARESPKWLKKAPRGPQEGPQLHAKCTDVRPFCASSRNEF
eukprot:3558053-Pyramimonas_sp.AAC.1